LCGRFLKSLPLFGFTRSNIILNDCGVKGIGNTIFLVATNFLILAHLQSISQKRRKTLASVSYNTTFRMTAGTGAHDSFAIVCKGYQRLCALADIGRVAYDTTVAVYRQSYFHWELIKITGNSERRTL